MTTKCEFHERPCKYCLDHQLEVKRCKIDNLPVSAGLCKIPCGECDNIKK